MDIVRKAREFASHAHRDHVRNDEAKTPYVHHLAEVAKLVEVSGGDDSEIAAAWLHDTVEDTSTTFEDIQREFGGEIAAIVCGMTDLPEWGSLSSRAQAAPGRAYCGGACQRQTREARRPVLQRRDRRKRRRIRKRQQPGLHRGRPAHCGSVWRGERVFGRSLSRTSPDSPQEPAGRDALIRSRARAMPSSAISYRQTLH